jgi:hypothetical protein
LGTTLLEDVQEHDVLTAMLTDFDMKDNNFGLNRPNIVDAVGEDDPQTTRKWPCSLITPFESTTKALTLTQYQVGFDGPDVKTIDINDYFNKLDAGWKCCLATMDTELGVGIETTSMLFKIDYFLNKFPDIRDGDKFTKLCRDLGCHNFLEHYFMSVLKNEDYLWIVKNNESTILPNSGLGVSSNSEYYSLLPLNDSTDEWMFYFYTYNLDERRLNLQITDGDIEIYNETITISEQREFSKKINYSGTPLDITVNLYDGDNLYKTETYNLNNQTINQYFKNGHFREKL